jgi:hypothetical protein
VSRHLREDQAEDRCDEQRLARAYCDEQNTEHQPAGVPLFGQKRQREAAEGNALRARADRHQVIAESPQQSGRLERGHKEGHRVGDQRESGDEWAQV